MSEISNIIFNGKEHYVTSVYGKRKVISTAAGKTDSFHYGTDYGTNGKKLAQYAIENGTILSCGKASDGANYVWVKYPKLNKKFLHYHLDRISVKAGQPVVKGTLLGYTGKTGKATGIHLHLGVKDLTTDKYEDPEKLNYEEYEKGTYSVDTKLLRVRKGASTSYSFLKFSELSRNAQVQILDNNKGKQADGLVKNCRCTVSKVKNGWGKIPSGWICLAWCRRA